MTAAWTRRAQMIEAVVGVVMTLMLATLPELKGLSLAVPKYASGQALPMRSRGGGDTSSFSRLASDLAEPSESDEDPALSACQRIFPTPRPEDKDLKMYFTDISVVPMEQCDPILASYEQECEALESKGKAVSDYFPASKGEKERQTCMRCDRTAVGLKYTAHRAGQIRDYYVNNNSSSTSSHGIEEVEKEWSPVVASKRLNSTHSEILQYFQPEDGGYFGQGKYSSTKGHCCRSIFVKPIPQPPALCEEGYYSVGQPYAEELFGRCMAECKKSDFAIQGAGCDGSYEFCMVLTSRWYGIDEGDRLGLRELYCYRNRNTHSVSYKGTYLDSSLWSTSPTEEKFVNCFLNATWVDEGSKPPKDEAIFTADNSLLKEETRDPDDPQKSKSSASALHLGQSYCQSGWLLSVLFVSLAGKMIR